MSTSLSPLLSPPEVAKILGVPTATLANWRWRGTGPAYARVGAHVRYRVEDVDRWVTDQTRGGPDAPAA